MPGLRLAFSALLLSASACSIICGSACDFVVPGECLGPGGLFGECVDGGCADGLVCFHGLAGNICVRPELVGEPDPADEACAKAVGDAGATFECHPFGGGCLVTCDNDGQCHGGTVCEENVGGCMHPVDEYDVRPPRGAELGPCDPDLETGCGYHPDVCLVAAGGEGTLCVNKEHPEWLVPCSAEAPACPNGQVCGTVEGVCVWPHEQVECLGPGQMFGPCVDDQCDDGLVCMESSQGSICTPNLEVAESAAAEECAEERGMFGMHCNPVWQTCHVPCANDGWCLGGTVCSEDMEICVYPETETDIKPPPGNTLGPCMGDDMLCINEGDECIVSLVVDGNLCAPKNKSWWVVPCDVDTSCPNGQVCAEDLGSCVWPG